ncbi:hypothetical protein G5I_09649 [Acromyrmex echinatior]|uniref:Uncharacterized protein n=1 Tax=Acromyrmex echinatior TaxID=103372 RepID=F4WUS2_ACREC|nr:hypothetical protein G5I_09649 [Acromyrmex echinatior]
MQRCLLRQATAAYSASVSTRMPLPMSGYVCEQTTSLPTRKCLRRRDEEACRCTLKVKKGSLGGKSGNFSGRTTCSGNSHPFHRALCPSGYASTVWDKLTGIEFTLATVNPSGAQFLGHGEADLAINVFRANKRKAACDSLKATFFNVLSLMKPQQDTSTSPCTNTSSPGACE